MYRRPSDVEATSQRRAALFNVCNVIININRFNIKQNQQLKWGVAGHAACRPTSLSRGIQVANSIPNKPHVVFAGIGFSLMNMAEIMAQAAMIAENQKATCMASP